MSHAMSAMILAVASKKRRARLFDCSSPRTGTLAAPAPPVPQLSVNRVEAAHGVTENLVVLREACELLVPPTHAREVTVATVIGQRLRFRDDVVNLHGL